jgi:hypothetical protein
VFASSLARTIPLLSLNNTACNYDAGLWHVPGECRLAYTVFLAIFGIIMLAMCCFDLSALANVQVRMLANFFVDVTFSLF